jgi:putative NADH-flavin reductase
MPTHCLALFGATGGTGRQIVTQALEAGHTVRALVRDPARLPIQHPQLHLITGNVLDPDAVERTITGADAVIVTLGNTANNPDWIVSEGTRVIVTAMQKLGVRRLIVISSLGVGDSRDQVPTFFKVLMKTALKKAMEDKERQEQIVAASGLDWTIVRPGGLTNGPRTGRYRAGLDRTLVAGQVSRADVAEFVLRQLDDPTYLHKTPAIT